MAYEIVCSYISERLQSGKIPDEIAIKLASVFYPKGVSTFSLDSNHDVALPLKRRKNKQTKKTTFLSVGQKTKGPHY